MSKPYRLLGLVFLLGFTAVASYARTTGGAWYAAVAVPEVLPAAAASPVDVTVEDTLYPGETVSELFVRAEVAEPEIQALLEELRRHHDPRRMRPGSIFAFRRSARDGALRRMDLRLDADRTLALLRDGDDWTGSIAQVPVYADTIVITGVVETSLYRALLEGRDTDVPATEREIVVDLLADRIFAWQIDFSRDLRRGDRFRLLYERLVRPDGSAREGRVLGAQFSVDSRDYEAYVFTPGQDMADQYYDRTGDSVRRAFLRAPLQYRRISSAFSRSRFHPILRVNRPHNGIDYAAAAGAPVYAVGDGVVQRAGNGGSYGNVVDLRHTHGFATRYAHLRGFASGIRAGARVTQGDVIGYVGATGQATGPHLHYEFHQNGRAVNPNIVLDITGDPVPPAYISQFADVVRAHIASLDRVSSRFLLADANPRSASGRGD